MYHCRSVNGELLTCLVERALATSSVRGELSTSSVRGGLSTSSVGLVFLYTPL